MIADKDVGGFGHFRPAARLFGQCGWRDTHSSKIRLAGENHLDRHKKKPGQFTLPGFYRLLPQLVGSCDPGGVGVSGDGDAARIGLLGQG
jgi:hypothetical protein